MIDVTAKIKLRKTVAECEGTLGWTN